ncbi:MULTISPECIES: helix-turn-helix domain-containing protein [unclassified Cohnella]|uniref:response regulator transcription factor n=1 Tax=unclassified Cohnella TaxID=2636738 RepID=UPI0021019FF6|nr:MULTISPECIES: helix-turn-helix domain-containing protein [unclassified Cohnella]
MVRKSLESMIEELNGEWTGRQLVQLVEKVRPDLAFVNIQTPLLSGLDGIRAAKEIAPSTSWVVLTRFSEIEYAKKAIERGISDYMLKPIKLKETLARISEARAHACLLENKAFERNLAAAYQGARASIGLDVKPDEDTLQQLKNHGQALLNASSMKRTIPEEYMNVLGIGKLVKRLEVTPNYLSAKFLKQTGTTFVKHLTRIRIIKAQELLTETELQIHQVAEKVGYFSARHFTKQFADLAGVSPSEYRKRYVAALHDNDDKG